MSTSPMRVAIAAATLAGFALSLAPSPALAVGTRVWRVTTWKDFDEGESEGVLLTSTGEVQAGWGATRHDLPVAQVFTAATAPDGTVWLGTGDQADLYTWDGGKDAQKSLKKACHLDGVLVSALAFASDGTLYAGTLPGGKIWEVKGGANSPSCRELAKLDGADQVWALVVEGKQIFAATGPAGKLFSVEAGSGKNKVLWDSGDKHLLALARGEGGALYAGSADEAILYRVETNGTARAIADFQGDEIRAIATGPKGQVFVAVNEFDKKTAAAGGTASSRPHGIKMVLPSGTIPAAGSLPPGRDRKGKGALFRVDGDGRIEQLHALADGYFTALALDKAGNLYGASGANGRVYLVRPDRTLATAFNFPERQVLALALDGAHPAIGTGDAGALYALDLTGSPGTKGSRWYSKTMDAGAFTRWGAIRWSPQGTVTIETRSGNTAKPDGSWSEWQAPSSQKKGAPAGREQWEGRVASPSSRYLQIRASLGKEARLYDVAAWFLPQNQRSRVTEITAGEAPESNVARSARPAAGKPRTPVVKVRWKVDQADDDELVYRLYYREESEPNWKLLGGPDPLTARELDWNTELVPDGNYVLRVIASDERANPKEEALDHELVSPPYLVDNRKPEVVQLVEKSGVVTGVARDSFSPLTELAYSIDGGDFQPLAPKDRLLDDVSEEFAVKLPDTLAPGAHSIAVRATDSADNQGLSQLVFVKH